MQQLKVSSLPGGRGLTFWGQWAIGMALSTLLLCVLVWVKHGDMSSSYRMLAVLTLLMSVPVYALAGVYRKTDSPLRGVMRLGLAWLGLLGALMALAFVTRTGDSLARSILLGWATGGFILQVLSYLPLHRISRRYHRNLQKSRASLIIGSGELAQRLAELLVRRQRVPLVGLLSTGAVMGEEGVFPVIGELADLREIIAREQIRRVYIAVPLQESPLVEKLYIDLLDENIDTVWVPDLGSLTLLNHSVQAIEGLPSIHLNESPLTSDPTSAVAKALMDRVVAGLALLALSPLMLVIAILVKRSSPGPIIFRQPRHGWNGQVIEVWKFRSMRMHLDEKVKQATRDDPRITPIGRFIRRTSIDELPQLFNVLQGTMSLVGPRPHAIAHNNYYTDKINAYMARHRIKPGITGLAQISGCRGETETLEKMQQRVELDLAYINNWSFWLDVVILVKTPLSLFSRDIY